ncbi:MAG TPA: hypothetical protein VFZ97_15835 [Acidimicrobiales bacterium]
MRARLMLKVVTVLVLLICTVIGARSCNSSSPGSNLNPSKVVGNGIAGVCANQAAVDSSGGQADSSEVVSPSAQNQLDSALGLVGAKAPSLSCSTTTSQP